MDTSHTRNEDWQTNQVNSKHICGTNITSEEYLHKQIKKLSGILEDIFMQAIPTDVPDPNKQSSISTTREHQQAKAYLPKVGKDVEGKGKITWYRLIKQHTKHAQKAQH